MVARLKLREMRLREGRVEASCLSATIAKKPQIDTQIEFRAEFNWFQVFVRVIVLLGWTLSGDKEQQFNSQL